MPDLKTIMGLMSEARHFFDVIKNNPTDYNVSEAQKTQLGEFVTASETKMTARDAAKNKLRTDQTDFDESIKDLKGLFLPLRQSVKENPATTEVQKTELHLDTTGGDSSGDSGMETAPLVAIEFPGVHQMLVRFFMVGEKSTSTKKPKGAFGGKIMLKIGGEASTNLKEYQMIAIDRKQPYLFEFDAADAGKQAHVIVLWTDGENEDSPQSEVFSFVIS